MSVFVTEHWGNVRVAQQSVSVPLAAYTLSSTAGVFLNAGTRFIRAVGNAGAFVGFSTSTAGTTITSTNGFYLPANVVQPIEVPTPYGSFVVGVAST